MILILLRIFKTLRLSVYCDEGKLKIGENRDDLFGVAIDEINSYISLKVQVYLIWASGSIDFGMFALFSSIFLINVISFL